MNQTESISFTSEAEFLAHAQALEQELAGSFAQMADSLEVHNNPEVARLFHQLADHGETHAGRLIRRAKDMELPKIPPWQYLWLTENGPQNCMQDIHYLMTPSQALQLAIRNENCALHFYTRATRGDSDSRVIELATQMLNGKRQHLELLRDWLNKEKERSTKTPADLDPPNIPE